MKPILLLTLALSLTFLLATTASAQQNTTQAEDGSLGETQQDMNYSDAYGDLAFGGIERNGHTSDDGPHGKLEEYTPSETKSLTTLTGVGGAPAAPLTVALPEKSLEATEARSLDNLKALYR